MSVPLQWSFGPFRLDAAAGCLWQGDELVELSPKPMELLTHLVTHAGQVVSKEMLLDAVWPETSVTEGVLKTNMGLIRQLLGDTARTPQYISTVRGRGYRFIAPVTSVVPPTPTLAARSEVWQPELNAEDIEVRSPIIGREAELARLNEHFEKACQSERQLVSITGEAGIGKTTLVDAFIAQVAPTTDVWIGRGQCIEQYGAGEPYLPLLEALGRLGRGAEGARLVEVLRQQAPSWLVHLPGLVTPEESVAVPLHVGSTTRARMLRELAEAIETLTAVSPLILVLEDLHWSDVSTVEWLAYVARRRDPARLFVLGTYRSVEAIMHKHPVRTAMQDLQQQGQGRQLALGYLTEAGVTAYLTQRFGDLSVPEYLSRLLHQRTNGNALFLVTLVDDIVRQGRLTDLASRWGCAGETESVAPEMPESLRHLIERQLEQLGAEDQTLLEAASVAGVEFSAATVAAAVDDGVEAIEARFDALARQGLFVRTRDTEVWPDGTVAAQYGFWHGLYQEVLYERVPVSRRVRWHRQIGGRLELGHGARGRQIAAELAEHFSRGNDPLRAVQYLRYSGEQALKRCAGQEATTHFTHSLKLLQTLPPTPERDQQDIDLRLELRSALMWLGSFSQTLDVLHEAETLAKALGDQQRLGQVMGCLASIHWIMGEYEQARTAALHAQSLAAAGNDADLQHMALSYLGRVDYAVGNYQRALDLVRQSVTSPSSDLRRGHTGPPSQRFGLGNIILMVCCAELGAFDEGIAHGDAVLCPTKSDARPTHLEWACVGMGRLYLRKGELHTAISILEKGLELCQSMDIPPMFPHVASSLGLAYAHSGRVTEALTLLEQTVERSAAMNELVDHALWVAWLSESYLQAGRLKDARARAQMALDHSRARQERGNEAWILWLLGDLFTHGGGADLVAAEAYYQQALTLADALGMRPLQSHCHYGLGTLYRQTGQSEQARAKLSTAIAMYRDMEMTLWLPQAEVTLTEIQ